MKPETTPALDKLIAALRSQEGRIPYKRKSLGIDWESFWFGMFVGVCISLLLIIIHVYQQLPS